MQKKVMWESLHVDDVEEHNDKDNFDDDDDEKFMFPIKKAVETPFGIFSIDDKFNPIRQFEFRIGHTNFDITEDVALAIEETVGVESLTIFSRYRFMVGIGKMFDFRKVRLDIEDKICDSYGEDVDDEVSEKIKEVSKLGKYWALYMFPNGNFEKLYTNDLNEYNEKVQVLRNCEGLSHGILIEYE